MRPILGVVVLAVVVARFGAGPFLEAVRGLGAPALVAALGLGALSTACAALRWTVVARSLGVGLRPSGALAACYRAQLVNVATPGGVAGDVLRGVARGRDAGDTALGLRSVVWERATGQAVQVALALVALLVLPTPLPRPVVLGAAATVLLLAVGAAALLRRSDDRREARRVLEPRVLAVTLPTSVLAVAGHVLTFVVAARAVDITTPAARLVPLALVVLLAAAVPANLAGWGPREGVAAWAFGAAGLGAGAGLASSVAFGLLVLVASLPGAAFLLLPSRPTQNQEPRRA